MERFQYRVWDSEEKVMIVGEEVYKRFQEYVENARYVVMECVGYQDKKGNLIFEGDYIAETWHNVKGVCSYTIKEILYHEKRRHLGERYRKRRVVYHDRWQNDGFDREMIYDLSHYDYGKKYEIIGNKYENPDAVENFRPNYKEVTQSTGWFDKNGQEIYEYHALLLPNGAHRVVEYNTKYQTNPKKFFLRRFEDAWSYRYVENLLTEEFAKQCEIITHTFLDEEKKKVKAIS